MDIQEIINRTRYSVIKLVVIIVFPILFYSCADGLGIIKKYYSFKFENRLTRIDSLINIGGYYSIPRVYVKGNKNDTTYSQIVFYKNGLFANGIYLNDIDPSNIFLPYSYFWGDYIIFGDTIKTQEVHLGTWDNGGYDGWEVWYKVVDRNTIKEIYWESLGGWYESESDRRCHEFYKKERIILPIRFIPKDYIPSPEHSWILKQKWFWKNENEWEKYMEKQQTR